MAKLISRAKFPINVKYDGNNMVVSPGEKVNIKKPELLPAELPAGLVLLKEGGQ